MLYSNADLLHSTSNFLLCPEARDYALVYDFGHMILAWLDPMCEWYLVLCMHTMDEHFFIHRNECIMYVYNEWNFFYIEMHVLCMHTMDEHFLLYRNACIMYAYNGRAFSFIYKCMHLDEKF